MTIVCPFLNPTIRTGGHRRYLELADELAGLGHDVVLLKNAALDHPTGRARTLALGLAGCRVVPFSLRSVLALARAKEAIAAASSRADWIMVHGESHFFAGLYLKRLLQARLLFAYRSNALAEAAISLRENSGRPLARLRIALDMIKFRWYEKVIGPRSDLLAFQSTFDEQDYLSRVPGSRGRTVVIRGNIGGPRFRPEHRDINQSTRLKRLVFVGTLGERKGIKYMIAAVEQLIAQGHDVSLDVVGWGDTLPRWEAHVRERGLGDRVRLLGRQSDPFALIGAADLMVVPSLFDSYPDVVLEGLHAGTPVIGSRVGGIPDILRHDELLFEPMSSEAISDKVAAMLRDPAAYERARQLCRQRAGEFRFDWGAAFAAAMAGRNAAVAPSGG